MFASILGFIGKAFGVAGANMCLAWFIDEPECPKSLIK
nr:cyclic lactone autoinducer peptide [Bacilli bacterium]